MEEVRESIMKDRWGACSISKRAKIAGAAATMHNKRRSEGGERKKERKKEKDAGG